MGMKLRLPTNGTASMGATSAQLLAANESRKYAIIVNASDVAIWLAFGAAAVIGTGVYLAAAGGSYTIDEENLWVGVVNGIAASSSGKVVGTVEFK